MTRTLDEAAIALHETYLAYVRAGFTETQALFLVQTMLSAYYQTSKKEGNDNG